MKKSIWEEADYWVDEATPAWWEIAGPVLVFVVFIAILIVSAWSLS